METLPHTPRLVAFLDERTKKGEAVTRFIVGCCIFSQNTWMAGCEREREIAQLRKKRQVEAIDKILTAIPGIAILAYADLPNEICEHETDGTVDIPKMARMDNIWSQMTLDATATGIACLHHSGLLLGPIDLYYDTKDLTFEHHAAWINYLRKNLPRIAREAAAQARSNIEQFQFGIIEPVKKPASGSQMTSLQRGTDLAHHFCRHADAFISRGDTPRILVKNRTADTLSTLKKFTASCAKPVPNTSQLT